MPRAHDAPMRWPRPLDDLDRLLGATPGDGVLGCYDPVLPPQADCDPAMWRALRVRTDERRRGWCGPVGDALRRLDAAGIVRLDGATGRVLDAATGLALDRAHAELLVMPPGGSPAPA